MFSFQLVTMVLMFTREQPIPPSPLPVRPRASAPHVLPEPTLATLAGWPPSAARALGEAGRARAGANRKARGAERGHGRPQGRRGGRGAGGSGWAHRAGPPAPRALAVFLLVRRQTALDRVPEAQPLAFLTPDSEPPRPRQCSESQALGSCPAEASAVVQTGQRTSV